MSAIQVFITQNQPVISFVYGLVFFIMGMAIAFQSRQSSRLELARSLAWLAAFGIGFGAYEWAELFSPVHEAYLSLRGIEILHDVHLIVLSISFACLLEFGVALLRPLQTGQWLHSVTIGMFTGYVTIIVFILPGVILEPRVWHHTSEALARYAFAFPGGLLAAYGLREQTFRLIAPLQAPHIVSTLRTAGIALAFYGLLGGLIVPPIPFFPGNVLNEDTFLALLGVPPVLFQAAVGVILAVTVIRGLEVFHVETERRIEQMEQQQILQSERQRLARELHDRTIQTAYTAGLLVDSARKHADPDSAVAVRLERAVTALDDVIRDLRLNLGELRGDGPSGPLAEMLRRIAEDPRYRSLVDIRLDLQLPPDDTLPPDRTNQLLAIVGEALANVVRHSRASHVTIRARHADGRLDLSIRDNGAGLPAGLTPGFGIRNMEERARLLGGAFEVTNTAGRGAEVRVSIPWKDPSPYPIPGSEVGSRKSEVGSPIGPRTSDPGLSSGEVDSGPRTSDPGLSSGEGSEVSPPGEDTHG